MGFKILAFLMALLLLSGCTGGSVVQEPQKQGDETQIERQVATPLGTSAPRTTPSPPPKYELYFIASTGSSTKTLKGQTEWDYGVLRKYGDVYSGTAKRSGYSLFKVNPKIENVTELQHFTSASWSKNWAKVKTIDGRAFVIRNWESGDEIIGYGDDSKSFKPSISQQIKSWTVVGDKLYYRTEREYDMSVAYKKPWTGGYIGGEVKVCCEKTGAYYEPKTLLNYEDEHNFGTLESAGGKLFSFFSNEDDKGTFGFGIYRRDLTTGRSVQGIGEYILDEWEKNFKGSFGRDYFYYSYDDLNERTTNLARISLSDGDLQFPIYTRELGAPTYIDADGSYVMLQFEDTIVVYDDGTGTADEFPSPMKKSKLEILSRGE